MGIGLVEDLGAALALDESAARRFADEAPLITDDVNRLEMNSPRAMRHKLSPSDWNAAFKPFSHQLDLSWARHRRYLVRRIIASGNLDRAAEVAQSTPDPADRKACLAWVAQARGRRGAAAELFREALNLDPGSSGARFGLVLMRRKGYLANDPEILTIAENATDLQQAVFEGWRLSSDAAWQDLSRLEQRLAVARQFDDCWVEAMRLRARWRARSRDPRLVREAVVLLDRLLARGHANPALLLRVRATLASGDTIGTLSTFNVLHKKLKPTDQGKRIARSVLELLATSPKDDDTAAVRARLRKKATLVLKRGTAGARGRPREMNR